jgi:deoxyribose-phosphate aldolase
LIDHTLLKPEATADDIRRVCAEAREHGFASVCVNSYWVPLVRAELEDSGVATCTVIGFPLGAMSSTSKLQEAQDAVLRGADELDMVLNVGELRGGELHHVESDIRGVVSVADGRIVKVILETALLNDEQKVQACHAAVRAGANFVKTSTGFGPGGATEQDIALMRQTVGPDFGVKASGGIRTLADVERMVAAGANRIGASAGVQILKGLAGDSSY